MYFYNKLAIFGGTFSPIHNGHIKAMKAYVDVVRPDVLYIIPTAIPPHKVRTDSATDRQRLDMLELVAEELDVPCEVCVSSMEIMRGGKSYTADTIMLLRDVAKELFLYCGTDMFLTIDTWHEAWKIIKFSTVAYMQRKSDPYIDELTAAKEKELEYNHMRKFIKIPEVPIEVSSTEIRDRVKKGLDISDLVPKSVAEYIYREGLYL